MTLLYSYSFGVGKRLHSMWVARLHPWAVRIWVLIALLNDDDSFITFLKRH